ncbi:Nonribosomal peptide synthetase 14 [Cercospora beticola]|uniref:Nonribosomal peptide synthetase 14 n=1 Tax=Cercospora beticola TaxID=122368 RepID=A0A2G5HUC3_CERBT|nr:Nonribosomal peptide synthetase 14 [Cercospora beticola]PIA96147.1 Nonribosomal peptide synthetase 14 [Cercospora beticola]WPB06799.1 hypothetical protein RHO25_011459 [Cercospora beticola]
MEFSTPSSQARSDSISDCVHMTHAHDAGANGVTHNTRNASRLPSDVTVGLGTATDTTPVAICGMGLRLPGSIHDPTSMFNFLMNGKDARTPTDDKRFNINGYYNKSSGIGTMPMNHGYWLDDLDLRQFDTAMFNMTASEAERLDPRQRLLLEVAREALESAGETGWRGKSIGCYVGAFGEDWQELHSKDPLDSGIYRITGYLDFALSNRLSYEFDLRGPSMTIKTACSSTGTALHLACQAIAQNECTAAIVAGVNLILTPTLSLAMTDQGGLSADASCKTFDASANGYARAEAASAIYIKKWDAAMRDGDPIRAVIRNTASNFDGKTQGITNPSAEAQEALIRQAYGRAGLDPARTAMVECHGTGTAVGDPLELEAVANVFGRKGVFIGSVKPNFGHGEAAATLTSILKSVLALENKIMFPNIKFTNPNPKIPFNDAKLMVPVKPTAWPDDRAEVISVNSFGVGGTNVHIVLQSAASFALEKSVKHLHTSLAAVDTTMLLVFSAASKESLKAVADNCQAYLRAHPDRFAHLAYTLALRREHLQFRSFTVVECRNAGEDVAASATTMQARTENAACHQTTQNCKFDKNGVRHVPDLTISPPIKCQAARQTLFVFTGQGAQWARMGQSLMDKQPRFLQSLRDMDLILQSLDHSPKWTIEGEIGKDENLSRLDEPEICQPICTSLQIALVQLLLHWGVRPAAVIGHSSGEIAAAYAAGSLTMREAMVTAYYRGYVASQQKRNGGMAVVGMSQDHARLFCSPGVEIACKNSGKNVTLSGDMEQLDVVLASIAKAEPDVFIRRLPVQEAYHSYHMKDIGGAYCEYITEHLTPCEPTVPFFSSVHGARLASAVKLDATYWRSNLEQPVEFHAATKQMLCSFPRDTTVLEVGPHAALAGPLKQIANELSSANQYLAVLTRRQDDNYCFLKAMGQLHCIGHQVSFPYHGQVLTDLDPYPWKHERYWYETRLMRDWRMRKHAPHELLGVRTLESGDLQPCWRNLLRLKDVEWLKDHRIGDDIVFPAAAYICMAGEASLQMTGTVDYTVKEVSFNTAMVLRTSECTEILTTLRPQRVTSSLDSAWFEFTIISFSGSVWNKHCTGLIKGGQESRGPSFQAETYPRQVSTSAWYRSMARAGLKYGPRFVGMEGITAGIQEAKASAVISDKQNPNEPHYPLHPTTLDIAFQTIRVAVHLGEPRLFRRVYLPTYIEELYVGDARHQTIRVNTRAVSGKYGATRGYSQGIVNDARAFHFEGIRFTLLETDEALQMHKAAYLQWKPDWDLLEINSLLKPINSCESDHCLMERMFLLCAIEGQKALTDVGPVYEYLSRYRDWLGAHLQRAMSPDYPLVPDSQELFCLSSSQRRTLINQMHEQSKQMRNAPVCALLFRCYENCRDIFEGKAETLDVLIKDGLLHQLYDYMNSMWEYSDFFKLLGNTRPQIEILEVGAGTGGLTAKVLEGLRSDFGERMYLNYTFTDISAGFFVQAQERFKGWQNIEYKVLDISKDPLAQGFKAGQYDLIIASNVIHATPVLQKTLANILSLLRPEGQLLMQEICTETKWANYIMGLFPGWWLSEQSERTGQPYISPELWDTELRAAGFAGVEASALDGAPPYHINATILARPCYDTRHSDRVTLLSGYEIHHLAYRVEEMLHDQDIVAQHCLFGEPLPPGQALISFLDVDCPFFKDFDSVKMTQFLDMVRTLQHTIVVWLTRAIHINPIDPDFALVTGLARTIRSELGMYFATLELESTTDLSASAICHVFHKLRQTTADNHSDVDPDMEFAWANGVINISRFHWASMAVTPDEMLDGTSARALVIGQRGSLQTLKWTQRRLTELMPEEVQIKMYAVGMNFKDIVIAMGIIDGGDAAGNILGCEGSGIITKTGSAVEHVQPGDRVMVLGGHVGTFTTELQTLGRLCCKIPDQLAWDEAATMPCVYITVLRALIDKGNLREGQSVLIHSAAGGVGLAAINIARWVGARILVTVGTKEKADHLAQAYGIPRHHIFSSRDISFVDGVSRATDGRGVDVVLNSLSGELLHASWKCVARGGCMLELGKRDLIGRGQLAMDAFEENRSFIGIDVGALAIDDVSTTSRLLKQVVDLYTQGKIHPISPSTRFGAENVAEAFSHMQKGLHIGKIVVTFPAADILPLSPCLPEVWLRPDANYLLVGGLGGLGMTVAKWMVMHGARNLAFLSRSANHGKHRAFFQELAEMSCQAQAITCDVCELSSVRDAVSKLDKPIAGVLHMGMVLSDISILDLDVEIWRAAIGPKVQGTWNLHTALPRDMDHFVMFSSASGICGYWGQANYAAGNTFQDSFAQYRTSQGSPAAVIDIGAVEDVGFISQNPTILEQMRSTSTSMLSEQAFLDGLQLAMSRSNKRPAPQLKTVTEGHMYPGQVSIGLECSLPIADPNNTVIWKRDPRFAIYRNIEQADSVTTHTSRGPLQKLISTLRANQSKLDDSHIARILTEAIARSVFGFLMKADTEEIDHTLTLESIGVDSLVAIEIRNWVKHNLSVDVSVLELMAGGSLEQLGSLVARRLREKYTSSSTSSSETKVNREN